MKRIFLDIETTGLEAGVHQVLTVALLVAQVEPGQMKIEDSRVWKIKHKKYNVQPQALQVNGINLETHTKDEEAVWPVQACREMSEFIKWHYYSREALIGQNIMFDLGFMKTLFKTAKVPYPFGHRYIDTMCIWMALRDAGIINVEGARLQNMASYFELSYDGAHDALFDTTLTAQVYVRLLEKMGGQICQTKQEEQSVLGSQE